MNQHASFQRRLALLARLVSGAVDCQMETQTNATRGEWDFADANLRTLFRNAAAITRQRKAVLRAVRRVCREGKSR